MSSNTTELFNDGASQLRAEMAAVRCELNDDIKEVAAQAKQLTDWRHYVRQAPWLSIAVAALAGFAVVPARSHGTKLDAAEFSKPTKQTHSNVESKSTVGSGWTGFLVRMATAALIRTAIGVASETLGEMATKATVPSPQHPTAPEGITS